MLYVSRVFDEWEILGVVDTDDNTETFIRIEEAFETVSKYDISINGVIMSRSLRQIFPWQPPNSKSPLQVKFKVMYDADIILYDGELVGVHIGVNAPYKVIIDVSDFSTKISGGVQFWWDGTMRSECKIFIVLNDSVEITSQTLPVSMFNTCFDISEVSNPGVVSSMYMRLVECMSVNPEFDLWSEYIKDRPGRGTPWFCAAKLSVLAGESRLRDLCEKYDFDELGPKFEVMFKEWFDSVLSLRVSETDVMMLACSIHSRTVLSNMQNAAVFKIARKALDFEYLKTSFLDFVEKLYALDKVRKCRIVLFCNFLRVCKCSESIQSRYVSLCHNLAEDVLSALSSRGDA